MAYSRRKMIGLLGGGAVAAAAAGAGGFAATRRPEAALAPWQAAGSYSDPRMAALSWAVLAPNPHNRQPWLAELLEDGGLRIWRDGSLNLPETDPYDRQLTIGMGCFLEVFRQAAVEQGLRAETALFPDGEGGPVAGILLAPGGEPDPLFRHVAARHTNRRAYEDRLPPEPALAALAHEATAVITDPGTVAGLRALTWAAMRTEMETPRTHMESVRLMRFGKREIEAAPDGIYLGGPVLEALMAAGMLTREGQADPASREFGQAQDMLQAAMTATPAYAAVITADNSRASQIEAGRRWVRLHLTATGQGLSMQPVSQALQEYPEQAGHYARVHGLLAKPGETVQMLGRLGYGPAAGPSPRWPVESRLVDA
ncbi:Acg family FMN-binding oxidoreductase [Roseobacteraceae bacterium NS-SX3]